MRSVCASIDLLAIAWRLLMQLLVPIRWTVRGAGTCYRAVAMSSSLEVRMPWEMCSRAFPLVQVVVHSAGTVLQLLTASVCVYLGIFEYKLFIDWNWATRCAAFRIYR